MLIRIELYKPENTDYEHNGDMPLLPESASVKAILNGSWKAEIQHPIDEEGRWKWIEEDAVVKLHNGDMPLLPESASVKAILNGSWKAEIQHPIDEEGRWKWIEEDAVVKLESFNGTQLFRIKKKAKSEAGVSAELEPVFMDAIDDCFLLDIRPTEKNGQQALDIMTAPNKKYSGKSNIKIISTAYYQTKNLIEAICGEEENSFLNRWGGEVLFDNYTITVNNGDMPLLPESASVKAILNGSWKAEIQHPIDEEGRWKWIEEDAVVKLESFNGTQLFRIKKKAKSEAGVSAELEPVFMDAIDDCFLLDIRPTEKNGQQALDIMTAPNKKYSGKSNIKIISTAYYQTKNLIEAICGEEENSFLNRWGGEVLFDNYTITVNDRVGIDHGVQVLYGKNIAENGLQEEIDTSEVITRIVPKAYNGYMIEGNEPWVDSPLLDKYPTIKYGVITFEDVKMKADAAEDDEENGIMICNTQEELNNALKEKCEEQFESGIDKPKVTISADMVMLHDTELYADIRELEEVSIGDTVHCRHSKLDIVTDARVIELEWDCINEEVASVVLGDFQYNFITDVSSMSNRIESAIRPDGTVIGAQVNGIINGVKAQFRAQSDIAQKQKVRAVLFEDLNPESETFGAMCLGTMGFEIASKRTADGRDWDWSTFGTGQGFFADFITAGTMLADRIRGGTLEIGGLDNNSGVARVLDASGKEIVRLDKDGIYAEGKYICDSLNDNRRVTIKDGTILFSNKNDEGVLCMTYVGNAVLFTDGNGKILLRITKDAVLLDAENVGPGVYGKTGTAVFSNGTNLRFEKGFLVGGITKEGDF